MTVGFTFLNADGTDVETETCEEAKRLHAQGYKVIPLWGVRQDGSCCCGKPDCGSPGKHPIEGWRGVATEERALKTLRQKPESNLGVATGAYRDAAGVVHEGYDVLDIDDKAALEWLQSKGVLPDTKVTTSGKGWHYWFKHHPLMKSGARVFGSGGPAIDIRSNGGLVVVPPSTHYTQRQYAYVSDTAEAVEWPEWLVKLLTENKATKRERPANLPVFNPAKVDVDFPKSYVDAVLRAIPGRMIAAEKGTRNNTLYGQSFKIGQYAGVGLAAARDLQALYDAAVACGLTANEVEATGRSGFEAGKQVAPTPPKKRERSRPKPPPKPELPEQNDKPSGRIWLYDPVTETATILKPKTERERAAERAAAEAEALPDVSSTVDPVKVDAIAIDDEALTRGPEKTRRRRAILNAARLIARDEGDEKAARAVKRAFFCGRMKNKARCPKENGGCDISLGEIVLLCESPACLACMWAKRRDLTAFWQKAWPDNIEHFTIKLTDQSMAAARKVRDVVRQSCPETPLFLVIGPGTVWVAADVDELNLSQLSLFKGARYAGQLYGGTTTVGTPGKLFAIVAANEALESRNERLAMWIDGGHAGALARDEWIKTCKTITRSRDSTLTIPTKKERRALAKEAALAAQGPEAEEQQPLHEPSNCCGKYPAHDLEKDNKHVATRYVFPWTYGTASRALYKAGADQAYESATDRDADPGG